MTIGQQTFVLDYCKCWRRKWQPTPVFLPGESHGLRSLGGYSLWGCKELDITSDWEPRIVNVLSLFGPQSSVIQGPQDSLFVYSLIVDPTRNILSWCVTRGLLQNPEAITCTLEYVYYVNHFLLWNWNLSFHLWKIMFLSIFFTAFKRMTLAYCWIFNWKRTRPYFFFSNFWIFWETLELLELCEVAIWLMNHWLPGYSRTPNMKHIFHN